MPGPDLFFVGQNLYPPSPAMGAKLNGSAVDVCWMGQLADGTAQMTCCDGCNAELNGDVLTQTQQGTFTTTVNGVAASGSYQGC
jgi:hypothetical protein